MCITITQIWKSELRLSKHLTESTQPPWVDTTSPLRHPYHFLCLLTQPGDGERYGRPIQRPGGQASSLPFDQPTAVNGAVLPSPCIPLCKYGPTKSDLWESGIETGSTNPRHHYSRLCNDRPANRIPIVSNDIIDASL